MAATLAVSDEPPGLAQQTEAFLSYKSVVEKTAGMVGDAEAQRLAQKHGLQVLNLTWEDTGRNKNSADRSEHQRHDDSGAATRSAERKAVSLTCMPVIRFPNFSDLTGDVPLDKISLLVGNEKGERAA